MGTQWSGTGGRIVAMGAGAILATTLLGGCSSAGSSASDGPAGSTTTLKVGMIDSLTGPTALFGQSFVCAAEVLTDAINKDNFVPGVKVELTVKDDQSTPATALQAATQLTNEGTKFIIGGTTSPLVSPRIPITNDAGALDTLGASQGLALVKSAKLAVHPGPVGPQNGAAVAQLIEKLNASSVTYVASDTDYGKTSIEGVRTALGSKVKDLGEVLVPASQTNFSTTVTQVTSLHPQYVVAFLSGAAPLLDFFTRMHAAGTDATVIVGPGSLSPDIAKAAGTAANGVYTVNTYPPAAPNKADDGLKANFNKYHQAHPECNDKSIDSTTSTSYAGLLLIAEAAAKTNSNDPEVVRKAILSGSWTIPAGEVTFDEYGQGNPLFSPWVAKDGTLVPVAF